MQTTRYQHGLGEGAAETNDVPLPRVAPTQEVGLHLVDHGVESICAEDLPGKRGERQSAQTSKVLEAAEQIRNGN